MGRLLIASLKGTLLVSFGFSFFGIRIDSTLEMDIASLVEFLENLTFLLNSVSYCHLHIMCLSGQLLKSQGLAHFQDIEQVTFHTLGTHFHGRGFG